MKFLSLSLFTMFILIIPTLATADTLVIGEYSIRDVVCESEVRGETFELNRNFFKGNGVTALFSNKGTFTFKIPSYIWPNYCRDIYSGTYRVSEKKLYAKIKEISIETVPDSEYPCPPARDSETSEKAYEIVNPSSFKIPISNGQFNGRWMCGEKEDTPVYMLMTLKQN